VKLPPPPTDGGAVLPGEDLPVPFNLSENFIMNLQVEPFIISLWFPATLLANCRERGLVYGNDFNNKVRSSTKWLRKNVD
jgi:hypothetical protein